MRHSLSQSDYNHDLNEAESSIDSPLVQQQFLLTVYEALFEYPTITTEIQMLRRLYQKVMHNTAV